MKKKQVHKPNWLVTMLLLVMAILMPYEGAWAQTKPSSGDGSVDNPYKISTAAELAWFRDYVNGTIVDEDEADGTTHPSASATLTADIDLSEFCHAADDAKNPKEVSWTPIGNSDKNKYQGTFDGNGKTISNLYIASSVWGAGFFGYADGGSIKNITFNKANVKNDGLRTGILAGDAGSCIFENIKTLGNCSVEGKNGTGGIAGNANGNISNCENHAMVNGTREVGGVVGRFQGSGTSITSCANYGDITGTDNFVGGMFGGFLNGTILNSANYGNITGNSYVGSLAGFAGTCNLNKVFCTGNITAQYVGALFVGLIQGSAISASDILAYNSSIKLIVGGVAQKIDNDMAIGYGSLTSTEMIKAFTEEHLKSGLVAYLLQQNVSGSAKWGQKLGTDSYPLVGSDNKVYLDGNVTLNCLGELVGTDKITNTKPAQEGTFMFLHGDSPEHHEYMAPTCIEDGNIEYPYFRNTII